MARYELALRNAIDPLTRSDKTDIEIGWRELEHDEDVLVGYLKAAFQKELVLLKRPSDLSRANALIEPLKEHLGTGRKRGDK
jgi:hypothetical protein